MQWELLSKHTLTTKIVNMIGSGGFGNVYKYTDQMAVKEEFKVRCTCCSNVIMSSRLSNH